LSGVDEDFTQALSLAYDMVWRFGMGDSGIVGNFGRLTHKQNPWAINISDKTKEKLDEDVQKILNQCLKEVEEILTRERELLEYFAQKLLEKGELEYDEIIEIFNQYGKEKPHRNTP